MTTRKAITPRQIKALRKRLGLSQQQLAERLGLTRSAVFQWEKGDTSPTGAARILIQQLQDKKSVDRA